MPSYSDTLYKTAGQRPQTDPFGPVYTRLARVIAVSYSIDLRQAKWKRLFGGIEGSDPQIQIEHWVRQQLTDWEQDQAPLLVGRLFQCLDEALLRQERGV